MNMYLVKEKLYCILTKITYLHKKNITIGKNVSYRSCFRLQAAGSGMISIGSNCFFNHGFGAYSFGSIKIGNDTIVGENVKIYDHNHTFSIKDRLIRESGYNVGKVEIGNNCWIGSNCLILKGAKIGDNCVIGGGSVIAGVIPSNSIVKRNDAQIIENIRYSEVADIKKE